MNHSFVNRIVGVLERGCLETGQVNDAARRSLR
jgi:hypothetical protein